jgi:hypothetical protein
MKEGASVGGLPLRILMQSHSITGKLLDQPIYVLAI